MNLIHLDQFRTTISNTPRLVLGHNCIERQTSRVILATVVMYRAYVSQDTREMSNLSPKRVRLALNGTNWDFLKIRSDIGTFLLIKPKSGFSQGVHFFPDDPRTLFQSFFSKSFPRIAQIKQYFANKEV